MQNGKGWEGFGFLVFEFKCKHEMLWKFYTSWVGNEFQQNFSWEKK